MIRHSIRILAFIAALACALPALAAPPKLPAGADPENTIVIDVAGANNTSKGQIIIKLRTEDIAKFGQLYLQKGKWNGKRPG